MEKFHENKVKDTVRVCVSLPTKTHEELCTLAKDYNYSVSFTARLAIEGRLEDYLGAVRYVDNEQAAKLKSTILEIEADCRKILNNIRRIGVNYNQELRLKNAENKYREIVSGKYTGEAARQAAYNEYENAKAEIKNTCFDKEELHKLLTGFEAAADKIGELVWHIHG